MVLLFAAAYTYYTQNNNKNNNSEAGATAAGTTNSTQGGASSSDSVSVTTPSRKLQQHLQQGLVSARDRGSVLVHQAVGRCGSSTATSLQQEPYSRYAASTMMDLPAEDTVNNNDKDQLLVHSQQQGEEPDIFRPEVREEWIHAVFGRDFFAGQADYTAPRQGVGLSGIPSYVTYQSKIAVNTTTDKVGVTISRLPLGLYARKVDVGSEAFYAGVQENSVLVDVNGMPVLVEPSRPALERLWQYEGHFEQDAGTTYNNINNDDGIVDRPTDTTAQLNVDASSRKVVREPVALTFIKDGALYTVLMLSSPPWGISWAPCGNFPLVKKAYSLAADAGVRPGSLVAAVNGKSFREMDHAATALELRDLFQSQQEIYMTLCFTPAAARTGHYERQLNADGKGKMNQNKPRATLKTNDGVEVKFHPWEVAIGGLCSPDTTHLDSVGGLCGSAQELANRVTAGEIEAPFAISPRKRMELEAASQARSWTPKVYGACPKLSGKQLLERWDPIDALTFSLLFHSVAYDEDKFVSELNKQAGKSQIEILQALTLVPNAADMVGAFLLQFISLICAPDHYTGSIKDEKETEEDVAAITPSTKNANELTGMLLKVSRRDEGFCQRLYFLLRSFISTLESCRPLHGKGDGSPNLIALLNCLEQLRFAEKQLADRVISSRLPSSGRASLTDESVASSMVATSVSSYAPSPVPSSPNVSERSPPSEGKVAGKKKSLLGFLRKKPQKKAIKSSSRGTLRNSRPSQKQHKTPVDVPHDDGFLTLAQSPSLMYDNMSDFLGELDNICSTIERSLQKSFRQKIAEWAMQPWSASKDSALAKVTAEMRESLRQTRHEPQRAILVNPVESCELLSSIDYDECYILPSAHFPLLLSFNVSEQRGADSVHDQERMYRTRVELKTIRGSSANLKHLSFVVHGALAGMISESGGSKSAGMTSHVWDSSNVLSFDTRSSCGAPQTLSLRVSSTQTPVGQESALGVEDWKTTKSIKEVGFCWVDLSSLSPWSAPANSSSTSTYTAKVLSLDSTSAFDQHGDLPSDSDALLEQLELEVKVTTERIDFNYSTDGNLSRRRMLLYKHDEDLRQDAFAVQFIKTCDNILRASGLDMKLLTFQCIPVGAKRGFVEWVPGSVPLSEICQPFVGSIFGKSRSTEKRETCDDESSSASMAKASMTKFESLRRLGGQRNDSMPRINGAPSSDANSSFVNNPIQDYLRSTAYDAESPYLIRKSVMDTYVKSCAGYSVITYILGVGDRHLDNLLLHPSGSFFHCDFSFVLGSDPKTYLPMRITEDMIRGLGGKGSDNYFKFLSLVGAAFLALRRPETVRVLLSMVRLMEASSLPDISENQTTQQSILGLRERLRLDLNDNQAVAFIEELIETSLSSKMWIGVDAIHSIGKKF